MKRTIAVITALLAVAGLCLGAPGGTLLQIEGEVSVVAIALGGKGKDSPRYTLGIAVKTPSDCRTKSLYPIYLLNDSDLLVDGVKLSEGDRVRFEIDRAKIGPETVQNLGITELVHLQIVARTSLSQASEAPEDPPSTASETDQSREGYLLPKPKTWTGNAPGQKAK